MTTSAYDQVAYPSYPFPASHPDRLAVAAHLSGIDAAGVKSCRVLELGCGAGGNILPLADTLPGSQFVGVDVSSQQIDEARHVCDAIGLTNLELLDRDILTLDKSLGEFDYVLCHGVFSWTTEEVRRKILSVCTTNLSPHGVALINYNTFPGWHLHNWVRDMIRTRALTFAGPAAQIREARTMIDVLIAAFKPQRQPHHGLLLGELENMKRYSDEFLFHAILNFQNQPFYLHEFVSCCEDHALRYIGDAEPALGWIGTVAHDTATQFSQLCPDQVVLEQHLDFVNNTTSRRSLLCRKSVAVSREEQAQRLAELHVSGSLKVASDTSDPNVSVFQNPAGRKIATRDAGLSAALLAVANAWPASVPYDTLTRDSDVGRSTWEPDLLNCHAAGIIEFNLRPSPCNRDLDERPATTRLARRQAANQDFVTNLRHQAIRLAPAQRQLLQYLDGTHTHAELATLTANNEATVIETLQQLAQQSLIACGDEDA
ncbi:MAG: class I SAM-dependent methyltransferase [Planctomycetota bacterium]|nr:class I SAM-dependent methyltransferase [Planctomycetota bacterium]